MAASQQPTVFSHGADGEDFLGMVKSYNERRGFGFVASERTAYTFGRDVYISKAEARLASDATAASPQAQAMMLMHQRGGMGRQQAPSLAEEDIIRFRVRFSNDGMPQAEKIRRVHKFNGVITVAPETQHPEAVGRITSDELLSAFGVREAVLHRYNCGQARFSVGDRVTFCVDGWGHAGELEALLVLLVPRQMPIMDHVLGCFSLTLPRPPIADGWPARSPFTLDCHALPDRIILSGLPMDVDEAELMRFFSKHGATGVAMARSQTCTFVSVGFPGTAEILRFICREVHTFADDKETRLVKLMPKVDAHKGSLPSLPAPMLMPAEEAGILMVRWSPIVLATGYVVELRPAGSQAPWSVIDAPGGSFSKHAASCRISGLPSNVPFEARITYLTSCGCHSDASDASSWCMAFPTVGAGLGAGAVPYVGQQVQPQAQILATPQPSANAWDGTWQSQAPVQPGAQHFAQPPLQPPGASWRPPPPSMPELHIVDDAGYALVVQWPSVPQATAYVVELREPGAMRAERFVRSVPMQGAGSVVELRIGGLRPTGPGSCYVAQVRSVSRCGVESEPSPSAVLTTGPAPSTQGSPKEGLGLTISLADACEPPTAANRRDGAIDRDAVPEKSSAKLEPPMPAMNYGMAAHTGELPSLLGRMSPVGSPSGPAASPSFQMPEIVKEMAPEVAGNEAAEECIILD